MPGILTTLRLTLLLSLLPGSAKALTVDIDFDSPTDLNAFSSSSNFGRTPIQWQAGGGVAGSPALIPTALHASTYQDAAFDFSTIGAKVHVSSYFKTGALEPVSAGSFETYGEVYLTDAPDGFPSENDTAFVEILRDSSADGFSAGPLQAGGGSFPGFSVDYPVGTLLSDRWYQIDVTYTNAGSGLLGWDIKINDYGADGAAFLQTIMSDTRTTQEFIGFTAEPDLYAGFSAVAFDRVTAVDDFFVSDDSGSAELITLSPTFDAQRRPGDAFPLGEVDAAVITIDGGFGTSFPVLDMIVEFPLGTIPTNATVESARLILDPTSASTITIEALGYPGDDIATVLNPDSFGTPIGNADGIFQSTDDILISLDASFVETLLGTGSDLGVLLRSADTGPFINIASSESTVGFGPQLVVEYSVPPLAGDYNGDGVVDALDFVVYRENASGDFTPDDYQIWRDNYGATANAAAAVPEPASAWLCVAASIWLLPRPANHRRD